MTNDNVLVSREKWEAAMQSLRVLSSFEQFAGYRGIINMPDFIESEKDVKVMALALYNYTRVQRGLPPDKELDAVERNNSYLWRVAQAAINALRVGGE